MVKYLDDSVTQRIVQSKIVFLLVLLPCLFVFPRFLAWLSSESFSSGELARWRFYVAVVTDETKQEFTLFPIRQALTLPYPLACPKTHQVIQVSDSEIHECHVLSKTDNGVIVETIHSNDDDKQKIINRYHLVEGSVMPIEQRVLRTDYTLIGCILAFIFCKLLFYFLRQPPSI